MINTIANGISSVGDDSVRGWWWWSMFKPSHLKPTLFFALLGSAYTVIVCHFARPIGSKLGLMDEPHLKHHGRHAHATPLVGGLAVIVPVITLALFAALLSMSHGNPAYWEITPHYACVVAVFLLIGMLDDRQHLSASIRLVIGTAVYLAAVLWEPSFRIDSFEIPFLGSATRVVLGSAAIPFTVLCLVALTNAVNMADGRNGIVLGLAILWSVAFLSITPVAYPIGPIMLLGSLLVTFVYNCHGKLFLGDGGTYGLAACVGLAAIWFYNLAALNVSITQLGCLFLVPGLDMIRLIVSRFRRGISPFSAGHDHLHHYIDDWIGWKWGLPTYLCLAGLPILVSFATPNWAGEALLGGTALYLAALITARHGAEASHS